MGQKDSVRNRVELTFKLKKISACLFLATKRYRDESRIPLSLDTRYLPATSKYSRSECTQWAKGLGFAFVLEINWHEDKSCKPQDFQISKKNLLVNIPTFTFPAIRMCR